MQKIFFKIMLVILVFTGVACEKDFLEKSPQDQISDADFWRSENDLRLYVNNFYNSYLPQYRGYGTFGPYGLDADQGSDNAVRIDFDRNVLNGERTVPAAGGGWAWGDIRNVNYFLANYEKSTEDFDVIKKYVGETLFFKSWLYFEKVQAFGDLPWLEKPLTPQDDEALYGPRLPRNEIIQKVLADLDEAISYLPSKGEAEPMRVNKQIAQALKARIALYEGTWEKYHAGTPYGVEGSDGSQFLQEAVTASQAIIESGIYSLENKDEHFGYWKLFNQTDYSNSNEIMFWRAYAPEDGIYTLWARYSRLGFGRGLTKDLVDYYLDTEGKPIAKSDVYQGDESLIAVTTNRDPRLNQTIQVDDGEHFVTGDIAFDHPTFEAANEDKTSTGYQIYKGHNIDPNQQMVGNGSGGTIYFRYAEILLNYAEAKAELGTLTQTDVDMSINLLRDRVGMPDLVLGNIVEDPNWEFPELGPVINEVRRERRVELAMEGFRHDDLWRWAAVESQIVGWQPLGAYRQQWQGEVDEEALDFYPVNEEGYIEPFQVGLPNGYQFRPEQDYLLPIPTEELTLNDKLDQNPGW